MIACDFALSQALAQIFQGHIEPDLAAITEAVHDGSGGIGDCDLDALDAVTLDAIGERRPAEADEADRRILDPRAPGSAIDRHPNFRGHLQREFVELQR